MCPNEIIHRLLDLVSTALPHINDEDTLKEIIHTLDDIKVRLLRAEVDN